MTDKSAAAIREFAEKWCLRVIECMKDDDYIMHDPEGILSDLTALISEHYVAKAAYIALENTLAKAEAKNLELLQQRDELKDSLVDMVNQFAYRGTYEGRENMHTGGLSALEDAFAALGLSDPITLIDFYAAIKNTCDSCG